MLTELITQSTVHTEHPMVAKQIQQLDSVNQENQWLPSSWAVQQCLPSKQGKRVQQCLPSEQGKRVQQCLPSEQGKRVQQCLPSE
jgi:hypothetical protein